MERVATHFFNRNSRRTIQRRTAERSDPGVVKIQPLKTGVAAEGE
jgi:hypothetical protein